MWCPSGAGVKGPGQNIADGAEVPVVGVKKPSGGVGSLSLNEQIADNSRVNSLYRTD